MNHVLWQFSINWIESNHSINAALNGDTAMTDSFYESMHALLLELDWYTKFRRQRISFSVYVLNDFQKVFSPFQNHPQNHGNSTSLV